MLDWLSKTYGVFVSLRAFFYKIGLCKGASLPGTVISVGNIEVGGTGKTPIVIEIARYLISKNHTVAILTRGYGTKIGKDQTLILKNGQLVWERNRKNGPLPDEALLQSYKIPEAYIIVSPDRLRSALWFLEHTGISPSHWILDDGFQHFRIKRNLDLLLLDARTSLLESHLLPRGRLREPPYAIHRADAVIWTYVTPKTFNTLEEKLLQPVFSSFSSLGEIADLEGRPFSSKNGPVLVVCGIAKPEFFVRMLEEKGIQVQEKKFFRDHEQIPWSVLNQKYKDKGSILTTEKDFYRDEKSLRSLDIPVFIAKLETRFVEANTLSQLINSIAHR